MARASAVSTQEAGGSCASRRCAASSSSGAVPPLQGRQRRCASSLISARQPLEVARDVLLDDLLELLGDALTLEGDGLGAVLVHRSHGPLAGSRQADADVGVLALARSVDDAAPDRD